MTATPPQTTGHTIKARELKPFYGKRQVTRPVNLQIEPRKITAIIGPSGCGKSTVLRCFNRMHETIVGAHAEGQVLLDDEDIYAPGLDASLVRRKIGMVFQLPISLRTRSVFENVAVGLRLGGINTKSELEDRVETAIRRAALWDDVKDKLKQPGSALSGGQQQRLSIARTIAIEPAVILLDEPCSALDPISTAKIEELLLELRAQYTVAIVTHNMQQAARISDRTAVFLVDRVAGETPIGVLIEYDDTRKIFTSPGDPRTEEYISGRIG